jgi:hypothetical protein
MIAVAVRRLEPRLTRSREHPHRHRQLADPLPPAISPRRGLRQRFASDRDLIGLKLRLLVGLGLLTAALELVL